MPETTHYSDTTINLGDEVRDSVSGFTGIAVARTTWLHGCSRMGVDARAVHDGKPIDTFWFDESRLVLVQRAVVPPPPPRECRFAWWTASAPA